MSKSVARWLWAVCFMIVAMIALGGVTRLTQSGLSIVEWEPIMGAIPPMTEGEWLAAFEKYQQYPQYKLLNSAMTLAEFKWIFFWEWFHRLFGRMIGIVYFVPALYFWARGKLTNGLLGKIALGFALGGLQGAMGWFMVKSGLVDKPHVSHYRLAAHLSLALVLLGYHFWILKSYHSSRAIPSRLKGEAGPLRLGSKAILALVSGQIIYGAFVAGLKAGFAYNTFPTMNGQWVPAGMLNHSPVWINLLENTTTVQFIHRCLAWVIVFSIAGFWWKARSASAELMDSARARAVNNLLAICLLQFGLGVATLLLVVPVSLGTLHQVGGVFLLLSALNVVFHFSREPKESRVLSHANDKMSRGELGSLRA